jgi:hypothetical protein
MRTERDLFDEHEIRRALRLEADEMPPRVDPALIAAVDRASRSRSAASVAAVAVVAFVGGWLWSEVVRALLGALLAATGVDLVGSAIELASDAIVALAPLAIAATTPAVPIAILIAALIAAAHERWSAHAASS